MTLSLFECGTGKKLGRVKVLEKQIKSPKQKVCRKEYIRQRIPYWVSHHIFIQF